MSNDKDFRGTPVYLLVGGLGTRLRPVYADGPKALVPVAGKPFLAHLLGQIADAGLTQVILCVGHRAQQIQDWLGVGSEFGLDIMYSREDQPMGTAGALGLAYSRHGDGTRIFAMNGDSILKLSLRQMWQTHLNRAAASIALANVSNASRYGRVDVSSDGWIAAFREKNAEVESGWISAGIYLFEPDVMNSIVRKNPASLEREVLPMQVSRGLFGFRSNSYFVDVGVPEDLARARVELDTVVSHR